MDLEKNYTKRIYTPFFIFILFYCNALGQNWQQINYDNFEPTTARFWNLPSTWNPSYSALACQGNYMVYLQNNIYRLYITSNGFNATLYNKLRLSFTFKTRSFDLNDNDGFIIQAIKNGSAPENLGTFIYGGAGPNDFSGSNTSCQNFSITIDKSEHSFTTNYQIRIQIQANSWEYLYPDNIYIEGLSDVAVTGISLPESSKYLFKQEPAPYQTYQVTPVISPADATDQSVSWASADNAIATVVNGLVTPVDYGTTTITATTNDGGFTAQCAIYVSDIAETEWSSLLTFAGDMNYTPWTDMIYNFPVNNWQGITVTNNAVSGIDLSSNSMSAIPDFTSLPSLASLNVSNNNLPFDELVKNATIGAYTYVPQNISLTISPASYTLQPLDYEGFDMLSFMSGCTDPNTLFCLKSAADVIIRPNAPFPGFAIDDIGEYKFEISNTLLPDLVITSNNITVDVNITYGDIDSDNTITSFDAGIALQYAVGNPTEGFGVASPWKTWQEVTGNVDNELTIGEPVSSTDALLILQRVAGSTEPFPAEGVKSAAKLLEEAAGISILKKSDRFEFYAIGNVLSLDLQIGLNPGQTLDAPETGQKNMMMAYNYNEDPAKIALATLEPVADNQLVLSIPYSGDSLLTIAALYVNGKETQPGIKGASSVQRTQISNSVRVYPNPFDDKITLAFSGIKGSCSLDIFDINGKLLKAFHAGSETTGQGSFEWDGSNANGIKGLPGMYFYRFCSDAGVLYGKIIYKGQ